MHTSHLNVLELIAVNVDHQNGTFSLISEFMVNGNIVDYIRTTKANRIRLVRHFTSHLYLSLTECFKVGGRYERFTLSSHMRNRPW
jgi:hypothetical protein